MIMVIVSTLNISRKKCLGKLYKLTFKFVYKYQNLKFGLCNVQEFYV